MFKSLLKMYFSANISPGTKRNQEFNMGKTIKKTQHYISKSYLKNWSTKGKVWVYYFDQQLVHKNPIRRGTRKLCSENFLYNIDGDETIENWTGNIESVLGQTFRKIKNNKSLNKKDVDMLKVFLALVLARPGRRPGAQSAAPLRDNVRPPQQLCRRQHYQPGSKGVSQYRTLQECRVCILRRGCSAGCRSLRGCLCRCNFGGGI